MTVVFKNLKTNKHLEPVIKVGTR